MTQIPNQVMRPAIAVMLANHPNTVPEPLLTPMYARKAKHEQNAMET